MTTMPRMTRSRSQSLAATILAGIGLIGTAAIAMQPAEPPNGPRRTDPGRHAFVGATVITEPGVQIDNATLIVRGNRIESISEGAADDEMLRGMRVHDLSGMTVYPALIDAHVPVDAPRPDQDDPGTHWNDNVRAQTIALDGGGLSAAERKSLRGKGFAVAHIVPKTGVLRGQTSLVTLADDQPSGRAPAMITRSVADTASLGRARGTEDAYPGSSMGVIALIRQSLADAAWLDAAWARHAQSPDRNNRPAPDHAIQALIANRPLLFSGASELDTLRAATIASEFNREAWIATRGTEYRRLDAIADLDLPLIVPVTFPKRPELNQISAQNRTSLRAMMDWEYAPSNLTLLHEKEADVSVTSSGLRKGESFYANIARTLERGLSADDTLAMLTTTPARLLRIDDSYGRLAAGMSASFIVTDGDLFVKKPDIRDMWIDGVRHVIKSAPDPSLDGSWAATFDLEPAFDTMLMIEDGAVSFAAPTSDDDANPAEPDGAEPKSAKPKRVKAKNLVRSGNRVSFVVRESIAGDPDDDGMDDLMSCDAVIEGDVMHGRGKTSTGTAFAWTATRKADDEDEGDGDDDGDDESKEPMITSVAPPPLPFGGYGVTEIPEASTVAFTGATIWTSGPDGIIENGTVVIADGVITAVGPADSVTIPRGADTIDCTGRHITPGLIDCHSHTGISGGVNEGTQAVTCEVRIGDVINPDAINWYRQLAGGITAVNQLHGSANPIGGQNSVVKLRWGAAHPDEMRFEGAAPGVKWALGENVKQSNWGNDNTTRYPQTRMGVEAIMDDRLAAGLEYAATMAAWDALPEAERAKRTPPRRDLELEAMAEIVNGERLIHCHSYRQDEILMLCRLAGKYGFTIGTFQHVLEGYKVADAIRDHAIGGSCFSDWWAYKFEVFDAIPYGGAIMHDVGVTVSFNSDSDELARRMNGEAAKAVKYGGVDPAEALKFVTLNPAKQLKIDDRVGSLEVGKDADVVLWSGSPLSLTSRCERTYIDGVLRFSLERDAELRSRNAAERMRLINLILADQHGESPELAEDDDDDDGSDDESHHHDHHHGHHHIAHADESDHGHGHNHDLSAAERAELEQLLTTMILNGIDPEATRPGDCGCSIHELLGKRGH